MPNAALAETLARMIGVISTRGHSYTLADVWKERAMPDVRLITYDRLIWRRRFPFATYAFTDFDRLSTGDAELAALIYLQMKEAKLRVLTNPALVKKRFALLRGLHTAGLNDFNVYRPDEVSASMRFPVFIRKMNSHGRPCSGLLESREQVETALGKEIAAGTSADHLIIIEYVGEHVRPGIFRKLSMLRIGDVVTPFLCAHDSDWLVKVGRMGIAGEDLYEDERRIMRDNPYEEHLRKVFDFAKIEYGRADYGFYKGRIQVFEINTNPHITSPGVHPSATRLEGMRLCWNKIVRAFQELDSPPGPGVLLGRHPRLNPYRRWSQFFNRTRMTP